jgi:NADPH:quinone reductase-like Zn-dependent oxidoreductase
MPNVLTPALSLPYPSLEPPTSTGKTLVVWGGSSSVGSMATQIATAAGIKVIAVSGAQNLGFSKRCGAAEVFDHKDASVVEKIVAAIGTSEFAGIFDAVSIPETYTPALAILAKLGGGHLACVHPPPAEVPENVKAGMIFAVNDIATPIWRDYVTPALEAGKIQCLPSPEIVGKGLEHINEALKKSKAGVSATKLVVEL